MAHFLGKVSGQRGTASRLGTKNSGLVTVAASWEGAVSTRLFYDEKTGRNMAEVMLTPWRGVGVEKVLYLGPVGGK